MPGSGHRTINLNLIWASVLIGLSGVVVMSLLFTLEGVNLTIKLLVAAAGVVSLGMIIRSWFVARRLHRGMRWLRTSVLNVVADSRAVIPDLPERQRDPEVIRLQQALSRYQEQVIRERQAPDRRLVAVLGSLAGGVVVVTETGQVSLLNGVAQELLGAQRARVGTSLFAAISRDSYLKALTKVEKAGRPLETVFERLDGVELQGRLAELPEAEGAIILFAPLELEQHRPGVEFDLELHDVPPPTRKLGLDIPLDELPTLIVDAETTGLDARNDRVISLGAVCAHGARMYRNHMIDDLVDPQVPIPALSTSIHGITDAMVVGARAWPEAWAELQRLIRNRVVVGHGIPFDLTIMKHECRRHGLEWEDLVFIDTQRLASLLNPAAQDLGLESLAQLYQIDLHGRHTALGDALVTAELFFRMLPRLELQGMKTLEDLLRFHCTEAVEVIAKQKAAGWITEQPRSLGK